MHFTNSVLLAAMASTGMSAATPLRARTAMSAQDMVNNINQITTMSRNLQGVANQIPTGLNGAGLCSIGSNPYTPWQNLIDGFNGIINTATADNNAMKSGGTTQYSATDAQPVCDAFRQFVYVHQDLLRIVIGKSGILQGIFLGPVASVLRSLESIVDALAFGIINSVPSCSGQASQDKNALDGTLDQAVCAYTPAGALGVSTTCTTFNSLSGTTSGLGSTTGSTGSSSSGSTTTTTGSSGTGSTTTGSTTTGSTTTGSTTTSSGGLGGLGGVGGLLSGIFSGLSSGSGGSSGLGGLTGGR